MTAPIITPAPVRRTLEVNATPDRAFEVFARGMHRWWPSRHTVLKSPLKETVVEPFAGGRWYQVGEDAEQCDIGRVLAFEPPGRLLLAWQLNPSWQFDPALVTEVEVLFKAIEDGRTRVTFEHRHLERMGARAEETRAQIDAPAGWSEILESYRKTANG